MTKAFRILPALLALSCERATDDTAERIAERLIEKQGREAEVKVDRETRSIKIRLGDAIVPSTWPKDLPVFPDATRLRVKREEGGFVVSARAPAKALEAFYRAKLGGVGWTVEPAKSATGLSAQKGDRRLEARFEDRLERGSRADFTIARRGQG